MSDSKNGGPAFPDGMTLRDWFAGQALAGFAAHPDNHNWLQKEIAGDCYDWADAMLAERKEESK